MGNPHPTNGFKKGCPGGPGRPKKKKCVPDILKKIGDEPGAVINGIQRTKLETLMYQIYREAIDPTHKNTMDCRKFIVDRTEGKAVERMAFVGDDFRDHTQDLIEAAKEVKEIEGSSGNEVLQIEVAQ